MSWGEPGTDPGQFNIVHNVVTDRDGWVYVADRENHRVQVFDGNGKYETQWNNMHRPCGLFCNHTNPAAQPQFIIGELGSGRGASTACTPTSARASASSIKKGTVISRLGGKDGPGNETGKFIAPHGVALDRHGDIYVGEVSFTDWPTTHPDEPIPANLRSLQKLRKVK